ncbi:DNA-binding protein [Streptomyces abikoensis]|uniref:DNA-binding protein n=1 Tax=Streptomyces abikoensis TaxID=97398 RepID=UPI00167654D6|nr:DNA-binding protein [Streptomyces abikoensis]GGP36775.1 integrase [Streptomyces abikoensis]
MTGREAIQLTFPEIFALPVTTNLRTAAAAFGISMSTAYRLAGRGSFPCELLRPGHRYLVPTAPLMRALGIEERPVYADDLAAGAKSEAELD